MLLLRHPVNGGRCRVRLGMLRICLMFMISKYESSPTRESQRFEQTRIGALDIVCVSTYGYQHGRWRWLEKMVCSTASRHPIGSNKLFHTQDVGRMSRRMHMAPDHRALPSLPGPSYLQLHASLTRLGDRTTLGIFANLNHGGSITFEPFCC